MKLSKFEEILFGILFNAVYKTVSAIELYKSKTSFAEAYFLAIVAEEELAKLIILPIAQELGEINVIVDQLKKGKKKHAYFNHQIKQEIFTSFGLQNRSNEDIEKIKQMCLYVGLNENGEVQYHNKHVKPQQCYKEIKNTLNLLVYFTENTILSTKTISLDLKKIIMPLMTMLSGCVQDRVPEMAKEALKEIKQKEEELKKNGEKRKTEIACRIFTNPFSLIDFFKFVYKKDYKEHLRNIKYSSLSTIAKYLEKTYLKNP